jgi:hypothetical protein
MRTTQLITGYIEAFFFLALGVRTTIGWARARDAASAHLALATGLLGTSSLMGAIITSVYQTGSCDMPPRAVSIIQGIVGLVAIYFFLVFLFDFVKAPTWIQAIFGIATVVWVVLSVIERPSFCFTPDFAIHQLKVHNPINYLSYIGAVLIYYAVILAILWIAFFINGLRLSGIARFRMLTIAAGFFLLFVAIGLLPRLLFGSPNAATIKAVFNVVEYIAIVSAPLLYVGFATPAWITRRLAPTQAS